MEAAPYWALVSEVLRTGPADGGEILEYVKTHNLWEALYSASRASPYASQWREAFGRERVSQVGTKSILLLAVQMLINLADTTKPDQIPEHERRESFLVVAKLVANCCAENLTCRRSVISAGVLLPLLRALEDGLDPNVLVPAIYNVCADMDEPDDQLMNDVTVPDTQLNISSAEARLARADVPSASIYSGLNILLNARVVLNTSTDILEYLAELIDLAAKPAIAAQAGLTPARDADFGRPLELLLGPESGLQLANNSAKCRNSVCRALLAVTTSDDARRFVASNGLIMEVAMVAIARRGDDDYMGDDEDDRAENRQALEHIRTSMLKLTYAVASLPDFAHGSRYGLARIALRLIEGDGMTDAYTRAIAYIALYAFIDSEPKAVLFVGEGLLTSLFRTLQAESDANEIYPALSLVLKLGTMWSMKSRLYQHDALHTVRRFLLVANMGFNIPLTAVTVVEMLVKGHAEHVAALVSQKQGSCILDDVFTLFGKGNEEINGEICRLLSEVCVTLSTTIVASSSSTSPLDQFVAQVDGDRLAQVLTFMAKRAQLENLAAHRIWYTLSLLATTSNGRQVALSVVEDPQVQQEMRATAERGGPLAENIKFLEYHLQHATTRGAVDDIPLDGAMQSMSLH